MNYKQRTFISLALATIVLFSMVAAAGVSAAPSSRVNVQAPGVVCPRCGAIASCWDGVQYWNVAQGAADVHGNTIYWQTPSLGGVWTALCPGTNPTVVALGPGNVVILARSTNGAILAKETVDSGASWTNWALPTTCVAACTGPTAVFLAATPELDVFYVACGNNHLMEIIFNLATATTTQKDLGGVVLATPAAAATSTSSMVVVVKGTDGIYEIICQMGGCSSYTKLHDGTIGLGASLSSDGTNLFLAVSGTNSRLYVAWSTDNGVTWVTNFQQGLVPLNTHALYWANLGGVVTSAPSAAVTQPGSGYADILVRGSDCKIYDASVTLPTPGVVPGFLITGSWSKPFLGP
jgi:hypothetical protein